MLLLLQLLETLPLLEGEETIEEREGSDPVRSICFANDASTSANPLKYPMSISQDTCSGSKLGGCSLPCSVTFTVFPSNKPSYETLEL